MLRIIFFALVAFLLFKVFNMLWQNVQVQKQGRAEPKPPRSVNDWPSDVEGSAPLLPEEDTTTEHGYWQRKIQDAYRQGYKDGLDDGKSQGDGMR